MGASRITSGNASRLQIMWVHSHHWLAKYVDVMTEPTTTDSIDLDELEKQIAAGFNSFQASEVLALIERLRTAETAHQEQVGREIRVRNNVIAELEVERDELKESLRTTRLEQANKAFQVDELETKLAAAEAERMRADNAYAEVCGEIGRLEEQVRTLTTERDTAKGHIKGWIEREARLSVEHMDELEQLREQVERLTEELAAIGETSLPNSAPSDKTPRSPQT